VKSTNKDARPRWPNGAPSRPSRSLGLGMLRHSQTTCRYFDNACFLVQGKAPATHRHSKFLAKPLWLGRCSPRT
jgi:hypothetical protein